MRLIPTLPLLLALIAPAALADTPYQVEMIVLRQNAEQAFQSPPPPENWAEGTTPVPQQDLRGPALNGEVDKLTAGGQYSVLMHQAWQQSLGDTPAHIQIRTGDSHFGHYPVEGQLTLTQGHITEIDANLWVNRFDATGQLTGSERLQQSKRDRGRDGTLYFLDGGHLAVLIKLTSLSQRSRPAVPDIVD